MSGPLPLEPRTGEDTLALRLGDQRTLSLRLPRMRGREQEIDRLAAEMTEALGPAVHSYEIAAMLESEGLTADMIRERYGKKDLFALADALYQRVPRAFPEPQAPRDPWRPDHLRCALRGALFALPGLAHLLTAPLWQGTDAVPALVTAGLVSWAFGQALGHRAYLRLADGRREAGRTLLLGALAGAALATAAGLAVAGPGPAAAFAAAQSVYLACAGVLLVLGREKLLLAALAPLIGGAAALLWWDAAAAVRIAAPLATVAATVAAAGFALSRALAEPAAAHAARPRALLSVPYGLFGLAAGALVLSEGRTEPFAVIVLTVSMGPAEWLLYRYRGLSVAALRSAATPSGFRRRSAGILLLCLAGYLLPLLPGALLVGADPATLLALGATLWCALLLQAFGIAWPPALVCLAAACAVAVPALTSAPPQPLLLPASCGAASLVLVAWVLGRLGRPAAHS
ncbi:hypothetical protein ABZ705_09460 [Streptomyces sp. NPDC006984]|uniref:hypothetical protein n=1 Tax=Streptomyces sp. NPDC006984 TaxID=3155463 RepID=UPI0033EE3FFB